MWWVGSCGQFALVSPGTHSMTRWPSSSPASFPTYSIFPGKRKSSSRHRNVASSIFRFGGRAILPPRRTWPALAAHSMRYSPNLVERLYEKSSNTGEPPRHEANHGSVHERLATRTQPLVILLILL